MSDKLRNNSDDQHVSVSDKPTTNNDGQLRSVTGGNLDPLKKGTDRNIKIETDSTGNNPAEPVVPLRKEGQ